MKNDARFFDFLELSPRGGKPRKQGMTTIGDEGESVAWLRSMLEIWGDYADSVKFVPALLMMPNRVVEERVKLYRDFNLNVGLDDPIFAIAYYQGKADELLRKARAMGFTHCQIDTKAVRLDDPARERKRTRTRSNIRRWRASSASSSGARSARSIRRATGRGPAAAGSMSIPSSRT
jgi:phosphosulfolactate synthase (CoM biosynthesis protein A)